LRHSHLKAACIPISPLTLVKQQHYSTKLQG
jgi:hypothetical protein